MTKKIFWIPRLWRGMTCLFLICLLLPLQAAAQGFMSAPFSGSLPCINQFDHCYPQQFVDTNGIQINYQGKRMSFYDGHEGYDWSLPEGTKLYAVADGRVEFAGQDKAYYCPPLKKQVAGIYIMLTYQRPDGQRFAVYYAHLSKVYVKTGQSVKAGQLIALSGNSGCSTRAHLHLGTYRDNYKNNWRRVVTDPYGWEGSGQDPWAKHPQGVPSENLWLRGKQPTLIMERR